MFYPSILKIAFYKTVTVLDDFFFIFIYTTRMKYKTASKMNSVFTLDGDFNITLGKAKLEDPMSKGYVYACLFFYDEVEKEIDKLRGMVKKTYEDTVMYHCQDNQVEPVKILLEMTTAVTRTIGDDSLDLLVKEFLSDKANHMALMTTDNEKQRYSQICEAIFMEVKQSFFETTMKNSRQTDDGMMTFKFARGYVELFTERQKNLVAPALRVIGLENKIKLNGLKISDDWTVTYKPEMLQSGFATQEGAIKDLIKDFIAKNA